MGARFFWLSGLLLMAACGPTSTQTSSTTSSASAPAQFVVSCEAFANATGASLEQMYGAANVVQQGIPGPEGGESQGTVLFPNDPAKRVEIIWSDNAGRTHPAHISVSGTEGVRSQWTGPQGLTLGESLADVERANGHAFKLYGFDWDYGGLVTDWQGGTFAPASNCTTHVGFQPTGEYRSATGDGEFISDSTQMRNAHPYVSEFGVSFPTAETQKP